MNKSGLLSAMCACALACFSTYSNAFFFEIYYDDYFGGDPLASAQPWLTATVDDGDTLGSVTLTVNFIVVDTWPAGPLDEKVDKLFFNFADEFDVANLTISFNAQLSDGSDASSISVGVDSFQADGDGQYDILFDFPLPSGDTWDAGETVVFDITSTDAISALSFNFPSAPALDSISGPFLAAAKLASTDGTLETFIGASVVPVPPVVWLFGSGLLGLIGLYRRKKAG